MRVRRPGRVSLPLRGQEALIDKQTALSQGLVERVLDVRIFYDTEAVGTLIQYFDGCAQHGTGPVIDRAWERKQQCHGVPIC